ncbi:MAG: DEDD exonuclease domain-containing protein [Acidimicrobiia bacterium]|nr:DEDD exonuclease domain-containing protein [Acidimicrobiia bacterium]
MVTALQTSFDDLGTPLFDVTFCVLDLETTGASPRDCSITEIGAVKVRGGEIDGTFQTLVNPGVAIPPFITVLTGITQAMVIEAPPIEEALGAFLEFCRGTVVVGHNVRFDMSFLRSAADQCGYPPLENRTLDTAALARRLVRSEVRNLRLSSLAAHFRSPVTPNHRAFEDAMATMHVFHGLLERVGSLGITALEDLVILPTAKGSADYRKIDLAKGLPRRPGVYLFKDRDGVVFYVGKAKNLRTRVMSYFHGDDRRSVTTMLRELDAIDYEVCPTELEASITELRLIHAHRPRHNRASRPPKASHWVTLTTGPFPRLSLTRTLHADSPLVLGPFRSRKAAESVMVALWDAVPIRRCAGRAGARQSRCAPAQLGVALCPCDGTLDHDVYAGLIERLVVAIDHDSDPVLSALEDRMIDHARAERFEEASWIRDRHRALARAIERRRQWQAMVRAGRIVVERHDGETAVIDQGRYVAGWRRGEQPPIIPVPVFGDCADVPPSAVAAAEADLIWKWMNRGDSRILDATGGLELPSRPVAELRPAV